MPGTARALLVDRNGYTWVGSDNGLFRIDRDGVYRFSSTPGHGAALTDEHVTSLMEAHDGAIWVGTRNGLNRVEPLLESVTRYPHTPDEPTSAPAEPIEAIHQDDANDIWIAYHNGVARLDVVTGRFTHFTHDPQNPKSLVGGSYGAVAEDAEGILWLGARAGGGLDRFDPSTGMARHIPVRALTFPKGLLKAVETLLASGEGSLVRMGAVRAARESFVLAQRQSVLVVSDLEASDANAQARIRHGRDVVWSSRSGNCADEGGDTGDRLCIDVLDLAAGTYSVDLTADSLAVGRGATTGLRPYQHAISITRLDHAGALRIRHTLSQRKHDSASIPGNVLGLHLNGNRLIVGTDAGLALIDVDTEKSQTRPVEWPESRDRYPAVRRMKHLRGPYFHAVVETSDGKAALGTLDVDTGSFDPDWQTDGRILDLVDTPTGSTVVSLSSEGLIESKPDQRLLTWRPAEEPILGTHHRANDAVRPLGSRECSRLTGDRLQTCTVALTTRDGTIWTGLRDGLLKDGRTVAADPLNPSTLMGGEVADLLESRDGSVWVAMTDPDGNGGIGRYADGAFELLRLDPDRSSPHDLFEDRTGRLWVAHERGVDRVDPDSGLFLRVPGVQSSASLVVDDHMGRLWIGGGLGQIHIFDPEADSLQQVSDGADHDWLPIVSMILDPVGGMWVASRGGRLIRYDMLSFRPDEIPQAANIDGTFLRDAAWTDSTGHLVFLTSAGTVSIDAFAVEAFPQGAPLFTDFRVNGEPVPTSMRWIVPPGAGSMSLRVVAPPNHEPFVLEYQLSGTGEVWTGVDGPRLNLHGLAPGTHVVQARLRAISGGHTAVGAPLTVVVRERIWAEEWFRWALALTVVSLVWGVRTWKRRHDRRLEVYRQSIAADLHDEVGSHLAGIRVMAELALNDSVDDSARQSELRNILSTSDEVIDALREIVWYVGMRRRSSEDLLSHMRAYAKRLCPGMELRF